MPVEFKEARTFQDAVKSVGAQMRLYFISPQVSDHRQIQGLANAAMADLEVRFPEDVKSMKGANVVQKLFFSAGYNYQEMVAARATGVPVETPAKPPQAPAADPAKTLPSKVSTVPKELVDASSHKDFKFSTEFKKALKKGKDEYVQKDGMRNHRAFTDLMQAAGNEFNYQDIATNPRGVHPKLAAEAVIAILRRDVPIWGEVADADHSTAISDIHASMRLTEESFRRRVAFAEGIAVAANTVADSKTWTAFREAVNSVYSPGMNAEMARTALQSLNQSFPNEMKAYVAMIGTVSFDALLAKVSADTLQATAPGFAEDSFVAAVIVAGNKLLGLRLSDKNRDNVVTIEEAESYKAFHEIADARRKIKDVGGDANVAFPDFEKSVQDKADGYRLERIGSDVDPLTSVESTLSETGRLYPGSGDEKSIDLEKIASYLLQKLSKDFNNDNRLQIPNGRKATEVLLELQARFRGSKAATE